MAVKLAKRLINVEEYHKMGEVGILKEKGLELIRGEIIEMSPKGIQHSSVLARIANFFVLQSGDRSIVWNQNPVRLDRFSEPEPDLAILKYKNDYYAEQLPNPEDIQLIMEVAASSERYEREVKSILYAEAGIVEYWIVNLNNITVEVHRKPSGKRYQEVSIFEIEDQISLQAIDMIVPVKLIFG